MDTRESIETDKVQSPATTLVADFIEHGTALSLATVVTSNSDTTKSPLPATPSAKGKPTKERIRVSRACDHCKRKKIRCTGKQPCQQCINDGASCEYNAPYARGKRRKTTQNGDASIRARKSSLTDADVISRFPQHADQFHLNSDPLVQEPNHLLYPVSTEVTQTRIAGHSSRASPEPGQTDRQGHFVGASSGLSFLLRLQRRLRSEAGGTPETSVFTLGDAILPEFDEVAFIPPAREEAESLLNTYFALASPTYRFLHRPTVEHWLQDLYDTGSISGGHFHSKYAVILTVFAQATGYTGTASNTPNANTGVQYFQAAEKQLGRDTEPVSLTSVQALLGCCYYILSRSRLNHCWSLFGSTSRLIIALGLHRRQSKLKSISFHQGGYIESECRKRLFWCAYNLDKYLSAIFGRPCAFHDDDIDQDMPSVVEDADLSAESILPTNKSTMNVMLAPLYHQKIGRILSSTLRQLYGIKTLDKPLQYRTMLELGEQVEAWRQELPAFLNPEKVDSRLLIPLFQRQSDLLTLASGHAEILIYRPCLFNAYRSTDKEIEETTQNVQRCLDAAMSIAGVIDHMVEAGQFYAASWFSQYQGFCAVVVLYTYTIRSKFDDATRWSKYYHAAERCQGLIATVASIDSLAQRFFVIMEEFRLEVVKQLHADSPLPNLLRDEMSTGLSEGAASYTDTMPEANSNTWLGQNDPLQFLDLPNWEQLDSLALDMGCVIPDLSLVDPKTAF